MKRGSAALCAAALATAMLASEHGSARAEVRGFGTLSVPWPGGGWRSLALEKLSVDVDIEGITARTTVTHVFRNKRDAETEGVFRFTVPPGAAIARLAMDVDGAMMDGELVEAGRGRAIYDEIVHRRRDPALLEHKGDDRYELWIFPIPARATKTVVITYEQLVDERAGQRRYRYQLPRLGRGDDPIGRFELAIRVDGTIAKTKSARRFRPRRDLHHRWRRPAAAPELLTQTTDTGRFALVDLIPKLPAAAGGARSYVVAVDSSRSMTDDFARSRELVRELLAALPDGTRVAVVRGDLAAASCGSGTLTRALRRSVDRCLAAVEPGGGSDLGALLTLALAEAGRLPGPVSLALLSDGAPSLGARTTGELAELFAAGRGSVDVALHTVARGDRPELGFLSLLARRTGGRLHRTDRGRALAAALAEPLLSDLSVQTSPGAADAHLLGAGNLAAGEPVRLLARIVGDDPSVTVRGVYHGQPFAQTVDLTAGSSGDAVERFWARAAIDALAGKPAADRQVVTLSLRHGVMSPKTSFLVLETADDYRRRGIARRSRRNARSLGSIEGVRVSPRIAPRRSRRVPTIRIANAVAMGDLDKNMIRRTFDRHRKQVRYCYERALRRRPGLAGTIVVDLTIEISSGRVSAAGIASSELAHDEMERCIARAITGWRFPAAPRSGGIIQVRYPYTFRPATPADDPVLAARQQIETLLEAGKTAAADRDYRKAARVVTERGAHPERLLMLLSSDALRARYGADYRRAAHARLALPHAPASLVDQLFASYLRDAPSAIPSVFGDRAARAPDHWLAHLVDAGQTPVALALVARWRAAGAHDEPTLLAALRSIEPRRRSIDRAVFASARRLIAAGDRGEETIDALLETGLTSGRAAEVGRVLLDHCPRLDDDWLYDPCLDWLRRARAVPAVDRHLRALARTRLRRARAARAARPDDPAPVRAAAEALLLDGRAAAGWRTLSELVELAPRDPAARRAYGEALRELGRDEDGCAELVSAAAGDRLGTPYGCEP